MIYFFLIPLIILVLLYFCNSKSRKGRILRDEFWKKEHASRFVSRQDISALPYLSIDYAALPLHYWQPGPNGPVAAGTGRNPAVALEKKDTVNTGLISEDASISMTLDAVEAMLGISSAPGGSLAAPADSQSPASSAAAAGIPVVSPLDYRTPHMAPLSGELSEAEYELCSMSGKKLLNLNSVSNTELRLRYGTANLDVLSACDQNYTALIRQLQKWGNLLLMADRAEDALCVFSYAVSIGSDITGTYAQLARLYAGRGERKKIEELRARAEQLDTLMKPSILRDLDALLAASPKSTDSSAD